MLKAFVCTSLGHRRCVYGCFLLYGIISFTFAYYGEMITYLGMTMPMAIFALVSWLRNPYNGNKAEVKVNTISKTECINYYI